MSETLVIPHAIPSRTDRYVEVKFNVRKAFDESVERALAEFRKNREARGVNTPVSGVDFRANLMRVGLESFYETLGEQQRGERLVLLPHETRA